MKFALYSALALAVLVVATILCLSVPIVFTQSASADSMVPMGLSVLVLLGVVATDNPPVKRSHHKKEVHTGDMPVDQKPDIVLPGLTEPIAREPDVILVDPEQLTKEYQAALAFMHEPMIIRIEPFQGDNPPQVVDCWVNGKGAEVFENGKWHELRCLPVGVEIVTRRKYVEVLARSKMDHINTKHDDATVADPQNHVIRRTSQRATFSVIRDDNPKGHEWLSRIVRSQA